MASNQEAQGEVKDAASLGPTGAGGRTKAKKTIPKPIPPHLKYRTKPFHRENSPLPEPPKLRPSMVLAPPSDLPNTHESPPKVRIIDFIDINSHTCQVKSSVDIDEPLFQPYPSIVQFRDYQAYSTYEQAIFFRNNDTVPRRIKVMFPNSPYFEISAMHAPAKGKILKDSKVASGMEVSFTIKFKPQEVKDYSVDLVVCTEREKFLVAVVAIGDRPLLQLPDDVTFNMVAVKSTSTKTIMVRNVGSCATNYDLYCTHSDFQVFPRKGCLAASATSTIQVSFTPQSADVYSADLVVDYKGGQKLYIALAGTAENVDISLSSPVVTLENTYISLSTQRTFKIQNRSEIPITFEWKACADVREEEEERLKLRTELAHMKAVEEQQLEEMEQALIVEKDEAGSQSSSYLNSLLNVQTSRAALNRKYRQLERALEEDKMFYEDDVFEIRPTQGEIWPGSDMNITVLFKPSLSVDYISTAYLDVVGREERLMLTAKGHGIGPKAFLSYDVLDIGDIFISSAHTYEMFIFNKGDIPAEWRIVDLESPFGETFKFSPKSGKLEVGKSERIILEFQSDILGEFSETFQFALKGSNEPVGLQVKGHVLGPSFKFDVDSIDFGLVSFDFMNSKTVKLINTCEIPFTYKLRIPQDGTSVKKEIELSPVSGTIPPFGEQPIQVDFVSASVKSYDYHLLVDIENVGEGIGDVAITAECKVPSISVASTEVAYDEVFLRFPYDRELVLINKDKELSAKYEIIPQDESSMEMAVFEVLPPMGPIPPDCELKVKVRLVAEKLGSFRIPLFLKIRGSSEPPMQVNLLATSRGPRVELNSPELRWGPTDCLKDSSHKLKVTNNSPIPAAFKTFIKNTRSVYRVDIRDGVLSPQETVTLTVTAHLDDTIVHRDQLHILITEGDSLAVPLYAVGVGTTIHCQRDIRTIDFGAQFTNKVCDQRITLENKGRRKQRLRWANQTVHDTQIAQSQELQKMELEAKKKDPSKAFNVKPTEIAAHFTVVPQEIELRPWTAVTYVLKGQSSKTGLIAETFVLESMIGNEKNYKPVITMKLQATFITPLLEVSVSNLHFEYTWERDVPIMTETKPLTLKNTSALPLIFTLKAQSPFSIDSPDHSLKPGDSAAVNITFDPGYRTDRQSHKIDSALVVTYANHPQKDQVRLLAEVNFPNLNFEYTALDFGCVLNDTTKTMLVRVTNTSTVDTSFSWVFLEDEDAMKAPPNSRRPYIPVNQVFDILPIRSCLHPGNSEDIEFVYYGHANRKFKGITHCEVEGGPTYEITLNGEGSTISYHFDRSYLDFGKLLYNKQEEREFFIINPSKVTFPFNIKLHHSSRPGVIDVAPSSGKIFGGEKQRVVVRFNPGIPEMMCEKLVLEIAHFEPVTFPIYGEGIYVQAAVQLPRDTSMPLFHWRTKSEGTEDTLGVTWDDLLAQAKIRLTEIDPALIPQFNIDGSPPTTGDSITQRTGRTGRTTARTTAKTTARSTARYPDSLSSSRLLGGPSMSLTSRIPFTSRSSQAPGTQRTQANSIDSGLVGPGQGALDGRSYLSSRNGLSTSPSRQRLRPTAIEVEALRIIYIKYLEDHQKALAAKMGDKVLKVKAMEDTKKGAALGVPKLELKKTEPNNAADPFGVIKPEKKKKNAKTDSFVIMRYVLDFGNVISGQGKTMKFKITNPSANSLSWTFNKKLLVDSGFYIEPDKVTRLPEMGSVDIEVKLKAKPTIPLGQQTVELPLEVPNGPTVLILLRANICVPEVSLNADCLDFGEVYTGAGRLMTFQVHNTSPVSAEWDLRKAIGGAKGGEDRFSISPRGGILLPDQKINVSVEFVPLESRTYTIKIPVKVALSNSQKIFTLTGRGLTTKLQFSPSILDLGPILPNHMDVREITLTNNNDKAIEIYSVDYDKTYLEEEEILRTCTGYGPDGIMRLPIRQVGEGLPASILDEYKRLIAPVPSEADIEGADDGLVSPPEVVGHDPTVREEGKAHDILLLGPPLSGKTIAAQALRSKYGYPVLTLDSIVEDGLLIRNDLGKEVRHALGKHTSVERVKVDESLALLQDQLKKSKAALEAALKAKKPKKGATEPPPEQAEVDRVEREIAEIQGGTGLTGDFFRNLFLQRFKNLDVGRGVILDSLDSRYIKAESACEILIDLLPNLVTVELSSGEASYVSHLLSLREKASKTSKDYEAQESAAYALKQVVAENTEAEQPKREDTPLTQTSHLSSIVEEQIRPAVPLIKPEENEEAKKILSTLQVLLNGDELQPKETDNSYWKHVAELPGVLEKLRKPAPPAPEPADTSPAPEPAEDGTAAENALLQTLDESTLRVNVDEVREKDALLNAIMSRVPSPLVPLPDPNDLPIPKAKMFLMRSRPIPRLAGNTYTAFSISRSDEKEGYRWILEPHCTMVLRVHFMPSEVGRVDTNLTFEVVGAPNNYILPCSGLGAVPTINDNFRNVFMHRIKQKPVNGEPVMKKYVEATNTYEFGPLLVWKDAPSDLADVESAAVKAAYTTNGEIFRITNNGRFPANITLSLEKSLPNNPFILSTTTLSLQEGETKEITVWAFPKEQETFNDNLVLSVQDNSTSYKFAISCQGSLPSVELVGQWFEKARAQRELAESLSNQAPPVEVKKPKGKRESAVAAGLSNLSPKQLALKRAQELEETPTIEFERTLLPRVDIQEFTIKNPSQVSVAWKLDLTQIEAMEGFSVSPKEGVIKVGKEAVIAVTFTAIKEQVFNTGMTLLYADVEGGLAFPERTKQINISVKAEGYTLKLVPFDKSVLNYGAIRVGDSASEIVTLANEGKYPYGFTFDFRKPLLHKLVKISPLSGEIQPGANVSVTLTFCSKEAISFKDNKDIRCKISEPLTKEVLEELTLSNTGRALFSAFQLQPAKGLNFGAIKYNEPPRTKCFNIRNEGIFEFVYVLTGETPDEEAKSIIRSATPLALLDPSVPPPLNTPPQPGPKEIGSFVVSPRSGTVQPGETVSIDVTFKPSKNVMIKENLNILISGSDPGHPVTLAAKQYEFTIDSCYPGIITSDWKAIFEEQLVVKNLEDHARGTMASRGQVLDVPFFCIDDKTFNFGSVVCSSHPKGVMERFKIINPTKTNAIVNFEIMNPNAPPPVLAQEAPKGAKDKDKKRKSVTPAAAAAVQESGFTVQPLVWDIPPHESRYINVAFNPKEMATYRSTLVAKVQDGVEEETKEMKFNLAGAGTLPYLTICSPTERNPLGALVANFGSIQLGRSKKVPLVLQNNGVVPATCLFEMESSSHFLFGSAGGSATLQPKEQRSLDIVFKPNCAGPANATIKLSVMHNSYDATQILLSGTAFERDVILEGLPEDANEVLVFPELNLDNMGEVEEGTQATFVLSNTTDSPIKFRMPINPLFCFMPSRGHILPHSRKSITVKFVAKESQKVQDLVLQVSTQRLKYTASEDQKDLKSLDWDDSHKITRPGTQEEIEKLNNPPPAVNQVATKSPPKPKGRKESVAQPPPEVDPPAIVLGPKGENGEQMVIVTDPEPLHEVIGSPQECPITVTAVADRPKYECELRSITFKPTSMYQARTHTIVVKNQSDTQLPFECEVKDSRPPGLPRPLAEIPCPFSIEPARGTIAPKCSETFTVRFLPSEVDTFFYDINYKMPTLLKDEPLRVTLKGTSYRPACHFEILQTSDYLSRRSSNRRNENGQIGPIESSVLRVLEVNSCGVNVQNLIKFLVLNPTNTSYDFVWEAQGSPSPAWRCLTPKGTILSGKKGEMVFEYSPDEVGVAESFYRFKILNQRDEELFLFVGSVLEPKVSFDRVKLDLNALLLGSTCSDTIHIQNDEDVPFSFNFDKKFLSQGSLGKKPLLEIAPPSGLVPPRGRVAITVYLSPDEEKLYNFNIDCHVRRKPAKLNLNLKGEGYAVHSRLAVAECLEGDGAPKVASEIDIRDLVARPSLNNVDFGTVYLNEKASKLLIITNMGKFNFDYHLNKTRINNPTLLVATTKLHGTIKKGERLEIPLEFRPTKETILDNTFLTCSIAGKYEYEIKISGVGVKPAVSFSFLQHDFGPCFLSVPGLAQVPERVVLCLVNNNPLATFSIDTSFQKSRVLDVSLKPTMIDANQCLEIEILFTPRNLQDYQIVVPFVINGKSTVNVTFTGQGIQPKLELLDPSKAHISFGQISEGQQISKKVEVINRSKKALIFELMDGEGQHGGKLEESGILFPRFPRTIGPRETMTIDITFAPQKRVLSFAQDLFMLFLGQSKKLLTISGQCIGFDVSLENDALTFGTVCLGSSRTKKLQFTNNGEMVAKFKWDSSSLGAHFSVSPMEGSLQAFSELGFDVTFQPAEVNEDIRVENIQLYVDGHGPLFLACTGSCVPLPSKSVSNIQFASIARKEEVKTINIANPTDKPWFLSPVLKGLHWKCKGEFVVPAKGRSDFSITFWPLYMTHLKSEPPKPELLGSLFFALPTGEALLYNLQGSASEPETKVLEKKKTPAKKILVLTIPVENWLGSKQVFDVVITPGDSNPSTTWIGVNTLEIPPYLTRDYTLRFFAHVEGTWTASVRFQNRENNEFVHFSLEVEATEPGIMDTIQVEAPIRQVAKALITIDNPLPNDVEVHFPQDWWTCNNPNIQLHPIGKITGSREGVFELEYRPLLPMNESVGFEESTLIFKCVELGTFKYNLKLKATPPSACPNLSFEAPLGSSQKETFTFHSFNIEEATYECKVSKPMFFTVPPKIEVPAGTFEGRDVAVTIIFEPESISTITDVLVITGGKNGEYRCNLNGISKPPIPQGPFRFGSGESKEIPFRNVFKENVEFTFAVDKPQFVLAKTAESIQAKATKPISIVFQGDPKKPGETNGKLMVSSKLRPNLPPWIFYLQGTVA